MFAVICLGEHRVYLIHFEGQTYFNISANAFGTNLIKRHG